MHLEANLEIPDALALAKAVASGPSAWPGCAVGRTIDGRRTTALGELARHQLTLGYDNTDEGDKFQPGQGGAVPTPTRDRRGSSGQAGDPGSR